MQALENMDRKKLTIAGLVVAAIFLFVVNIWSSLEIQSVLLDLTESIFGNSFLGVMHLQSLWM